MAITLIMLLVVSVLLSPVLQEKPEKICPGILLSLISILYPFYCLNMLRFGRWLIYGMVLLTTAFTLLHLRKKTAFASLKKALTPGICLYAGLCAFCILYTRNHLVGLWDELRLWGAVPKALYFTESLQLGGDSLIFKIMQPYPPGMPLLVYFLTALNPEFREGAIFASYGILFGALLLPGLAKLRWKDWLLFLPMALVMICAPCLFTSHGGDGAWFYGSLYIDPILGVLAGYAFYLSCEKPFATRFSVFRFGAALVALTIIKDSGAMFALLAGLNAVVLRVCEKPRRADWKDWMLRLVQVIVPVLLAYGIWKGMLITVGVASNEQGFLKKLPTLGGIFALLRNVKNMAMVSLSGPILADKLVLTYIPSFLILALISFLTERRSGKCRDFLITWASMVATIGLFCIGYIMSFGTSLPSFQRYMSATLIMLLTFVLLRGLPALTQWLRTRELSSGRKMLSVAIGAVVCLCAILFVDQWQGKKANMEPVIEPSAQAAQTMAALKGSPEDPADVYVLISEDPRGNSKLHHRIYYELLGTSACVRNFWNDVNIVGGEATPESWTSQEITAIAGKWETKLLTNGYDYIYVALLNEFSTQVLGKLGVEAPAQGDLYRIEWAGENLRLVKE